MHFLLDANMPNSAVEVIRSAGHACTRVRDVLPAAADDEIASYAKAHRLALMTRDFDFADERRYGPADFAGIVVLALPETAGASMIARLVASFMNEVDLSIELPGRLAIVEFGRVRLRPAASGQA